MKKFQNIYLSYWFRELDYNPANKINNLEEAMHSIIDSPLIYNKDNGLNNISVPRVEGISSDKKYLFTLSLINAFLSIHLDDDYDADEVLLLINNNIQLLFDVIKEIYDIHILYTSIKIEYVDDNSDAKDKLTKLLKLKNNDYEDLSFKKGIVNDGYYINYIYSYAKEYNFNIKSDKVFNEKDMFDRSMITSLSEAKLNKEFFLLTLEINDRYSYNIDKNYETTKDNIRGMILELKRILNEEIDDKI